MSSPEAVAEGGVAGEEEVEEEAGAAAVDDPRVAAHR